jgi:AraC-like DNA-binding protein
MLINSILGACTFIFSLFCVKLFFTRSDYRYINIIFGLAILGRVGLNSLFILLETEVIVEVPVFLKIFNPLYYSIPSFIYIYVRGLLTGQSKFEKMDLIHFLPFVFGCIDVSVYFLNHPLLLTELETLLSGKGYYLNYYTTGPLSAYFYQSVRPIISMVYIVLTIQIIVKNNDLKIGFNLNNRQKWIGVLVFFLLMGQVVQIIQWYNHFWGTPLYYHYGDSSNLYITFNVLITLGFLLYVFNNPDVFYGILYPLKKWPKNWHNSQSEVLVFENIEKKENDFKVVQSNQEVKEIIPSVLALEYAQIILLKINEEKGYLNTDYQISDLAAKTNIPSHHCSYVLNKVLKKNFREWINEYRVNHFIEIYQQERAGKTIEAIANNSGFKSTVTFYSAFKKVTGLSPSQYFMQ